MLAQTKDGLRQSALMAMTLFVVTIGFLGFIHTATGQRIPFICKLSMHIGFDCPNQSFHPQESRL
ncbi:MAG TPA: hypothetical protein VN132_12610 [Bdellovibrio sp.]|nr:hypothetical protein [Bdellovibrio sp.]